MQAGSFWNHLPSLSPTSPEFGRSYSAIVDRLVARGVPACPADCHCDAATRCGVPYAPEEGAHRRNDLEPRIVSSANTATLAELQQLPESRLRLNRD
jgi:hypothetical protein